MLNDKSNATWVNKPKPEPEPGPEPEPEKSYTKNVKGNRQIVRGAYSAYQYFKIPDGLDLEDKTKVAEWGLDWDNLYIVLVDGTRIDTDPEPGGGDNFDIDLSGGEPDETLIMDAAEFGIVYSEDNDEETDKPKPEPEPDKNDEEDDDEDEENDDEDGDEWELHERFH